MRSNTCNIKLNINSKANVLKLKKKLQFLLLFLFPVIKSYNMIDITIN
jgi:hypothetical protein